MAADFRQFDEHGFPLPSRYSDLKYHDDEPPRPKLSPRATRFLVLGMVLAVLALLFGPYLIGCARKLGADFLAIRAKQKHDQNDLSGALTDLNWAVNWNPNHWEYYQLRAAVRMEMNDLNGSLADHTHLIDLLESRDPERHRERLPMDRNELLAQAHSQRSWIYMRLQRGQESVDDATRALVYVNSPEYLNGRAYVRALAKIKLEDGLADVDKALAQEGKPDPNFLDTRGYLLHLLDRNENALKDLNTAIRITTQSGIGGREPLGSPRDFEEALREQKQALAVMYHHRGLVYEKLNQPDKAAEDMKHGDDFGYDPDRGVF